MIYGRLFSRVPIWIVWGVLFLLWIAIHIITFCKSAPFGPRPFRRCLLFVMGWYALVTVGAEVFQLFVHLPPDGHLPITAARILMYFECISFIPFTRAYLVLRHTDATPKP